MKNVFVDDSYLTATANAIRAKNNSTDTYKPSEFANAIASISGGGADGVGIQSVVQTTTSAEDGGTNVITVTKTDGTTSTFQVKNGSKGSDGVPGADGKDGADGQPGADGKSAYQYAQEGGYTGTETEFAAKMAAEIPETYTLPIASADTLGGVQPVAQTADMTQPVGVDADGKLFAPSVGGKWVSIGTVTAKNDGEALVVDGFSAERIRITAMLAAVTDSKGLRFFISEDMYDKQFNLGLSLTTSLRPITFEMQIVGEYAVTSAFTLPKAVINTNTINSIYIGGVQLPDGETTLKRFGVTSANDKLISGSWLRIEVWQQ